MGQLEPTVIMIMTMVSHIYHVVKFIQSLYNPLSLNKQVVRHCIYLVLNIISRK
jgi:hypothetical protein